MAKTASTQDGLPDPIRVPPGHVVALETQGVGQITGAMNHLNSTTQQTASASEELSATAEELSAQAQRLQELMAFFRLAQDASPIRGSSPGARGAPAP